MLGLFSKNPSHPLADAREAKRILGEIAGREPLGAVEDASAWMESLAGDDSFKLAQRLDLIFRLDEPWATPVAHRSRDTGRSATVIGSSLPPPTSTASTGIARQGRKASTRNCTCYTAGW